MLEAWLGAGLELRFIRGRRREQTPHSCDLSGIGEMRCTGDRDLGIAEIGPRSNERQRLDGLRGRPEERDPERIARLQQPLAAADGDGVDDVARLLDSPTRDGHLERRPAPAGAHGRFSRTSRAVGGQARRSRTVIRSSRFFVNVKRNEASISSRSAISKA